MSETVQTLRHDVEVLVKAIDLIQRIPFEELTEPLMDGCVAMRALLGRTELKLRELDPSYTLVTLKYYQQDDKVLQDLLDKQLAELKRALS